MANIKQQYIQDKWNGGQSNDEYITIADSNGSAVQFYDALGVDVRTSSKEVKALPQLSATDDTNTYSGDILGFFTCNGVEYAFSDNGISYLVSDLSQTIASPFGAASPVAMIRGYVYGGDTGMLAIGTGHVYFLPDNTQTWSTDKRTAGTLTTGAGDRPICTKSYFVYIGGYNNVDVFDSTTGIISTSLNIGRGNRIKQMFILGDQMLIWSQRGNDLVVTFWSPDGGQNSDRNPIEREVIFPNQLFQNCVNIGSTIYATTDHGLFEFDGYKFRNIQKANSTTYTVATGGDLVRVNNIAVNDRVVYFPQTNYIYGYGEYFTGQPLAFVKEYPCTSKTPESMWFNNGALMIASAGVIYKANVFSTGETPYIETEWIIGKNLSGKKNSVKIRWGYNINVDDTNYDTITWRYKKDQDTSWTTIGYVTSNPADTPHANDINKFRQMLMTAKEFNRIRFRVEFNTTITTQTDTCLRDLIYLYEEVENDL